MKQKCISTLSCANEDTIPSDCKLKTVSLDMQHKQKGKISFFAATVRKKKNRNYEVRKQPLVEQPDARGCSSRNGWWSHTSTWAGSIFAQLCLVWHTSMQVHHLSKQQQCTNTNQHNVSWLSNLWVGSFNRTKTKHNLCIKEQYQI